METSKISLNWHGLFSFREFYNKYYKTREKKKIEELEKPGIYIFGYSDSIFHSQYVGISHDNNLRSRIVSHLMDFQAGYELTYWENKDNYLQNIEPEKRFDIRSYSEIKDVWGKWGNFLYEIDNEKKYQFRQRIGFIWKHFRIAFAFCNNSFTKEKLKDVEMKLIRELHNNKDNKLWLQNQKNRKNQTIILNHNFERVTNEKELFEKIFK